MKPFSCRSSSLSKNIRMQSYIFPFTQLVQRRIYFFSLFFHVMHQRGIERCRYQTWRIILRHVREENTNVYQTDVDPACLPSQSPRAEKWERFRSDGGAKMIVFSDVLWPCRSPRWRWQRHSGIGCGRAWQASKASVLFLPGRPGTASQPAALQQPPN